MLCLVLRGVVRVWLEHACIRCLDPQTHCHGTSFVLPSLRLPRCTQLLHCLGLRVYFFKCQACWFSNHMMNTPWYVFHSVLHAQKKPCLKSSRDARACEQQMPMHEPIATSSAHSQTALNSTGSRKHLPTRLQAVPRSTPVQAGRPAGVSARFNVIMGRPSAHILHT